MKTLLASIPLVCITAGQIGAEEGPFVSLSFDEACRRATDSGKVVFIDYYTTWCAPCKIMDRTTFVDEKVVKWLREKTVALKLDAEKETALAEKHRVNIYPTLLFLKPDGSEIDRIDGLVPPEEFVKEGEEILSGKDATARAKEKLDDGGRHNPMARMEYARKLKGMGKLDEALAEFLWCYDEGAKVSPSFVGVRGSFLLSELSNLGKVHPPALEALRERRNRVRAKVEQGDASRVDLLELSSLNRSLGEEKETLSLYDRLRSENPDQPVVAQLREHVFDLLREARRYEEIAHGLNIDEAVEEQIARLRDDDSFLPAEQREEFRRYKRRSTVDSIADYYEVLLAVGRMEDAAALAEKALSIENDVETYNTLAWRGYLTGAPAEVNLEQARKAFELCEGRDAAVVDTLARILGARGRKSEACAAVHAALERVQSQRERDLLKTCSGDLGCDSSG